jgi:hypothetical protein
MDFHYYFEYEKEVLLLLLHVIIFPIHTKAQSIRLKHRIKSDRRYTKQVPSKIQ